MALKYNIPLALFKGLVHIEKKFDEMYSHTFAYYPRLSSVGKDSCLKTRAGFPSEFLTSSKVRVNL
jgi:hypothetical protein